MEPYFYCKYSGIGVICSDCKRNPINSPYKTSNIGTWLNPSYIKTNGTGCTDYIPIKEPTMVNKQEFIEKAKKWLGNNMKVQTTYYSDVWDYSEVDQVVSDFYTIEEMIDSFCKAMEE